ncbi:MAG: response regulator [Paenibacillaceae bacterium]|nr:response regulator [Paenibacillaceae bacterium]
MKVILIDDEELALTYLEYQLLMIGDIEIVGKYTDPIQGRQAIEENEVDLIFLDIRIPVLNGVELAGNLLEHKPDLHIVFVSSYDEYALKAFELNVMDYVLKPVSMDRLKLTVQRVKRRKLKITDSSSVPNGEGEWQIRMFGEFIISEGDQERFSLHWRTAKAQEIFFYLLHHRGKVVSKANLIEMLWLDFDLQKAYSQLYTAIYHIRKTLAPFKGKIALQNMADGYILRLEKVNLDVDEFQRLLHSVMLPAEDTVLEYERLLVLFTGEYLEGYEFDWLELERQRLQMQWIRLKIDLIHWYVERGQLEKAFKHAENICSRYPIEEQAQFIYMKICDMLGYHFLIQRQYSLFVSALEKEVSEKPGDELSQWYSEWEKKNKKE